MNVVKIDTEGAELWVLQGGRTFLSACRPVIFMEVELRNLRVYPYTYFDILRFFKEISYELATLDGVLITDNNFQEYIENGEDTYMAKPCRDKKLT
jgi:hypothetical protein